MLTSCFFLFASIFAIANGYEESERELAVRDLYNLGFANNYFGVSLHRELSAGTKGNIFFSPFAVSSVLSMLYRGTQGETATELRKVLGYGRVDDSAIFSSFHYYLTEVLERIDPRLYTINSVSAIIVDDSLAVLSKYKADMRDIFQAYVQEGNMAQESTAIVDRMNKWTKKKTKGTICNLADSIDSKTSLFLASAAYFKGAWKTKFNPNATQHNPFYNGGARSNASNVPMMHAFASFRYFDEDHEDFTAVEMFYQGRNMSMVIYLPTENGGLYSLERGMTASKMALVRRQMYYMKVHLTLPKFKLEYEESLSRTLRDLGINKIFTPAADLSGMIEKGAILGLNDVKHKAMIEVNERGSVASAVTRAIMTRSMPISGPDPEFKVDHPFLFAIFDTQSSMILFMGRVTNL